MDYDMKLIYEVRKHPELYDNTHARFKNKDAKYEVWSQIAYQLRQECDNETVTLVRMRWKSLRDSYVKETKHRNAINNGEGVKPKRNWRYAQAMSFLKPYLAPSNPAKGNKRKRFFQTSDDLTDPLENYLVTPEDLKEASEDGSDGTITSDWAIFSPETHVVVSPNDSLGDDIDSFFKGIADTVKKLTPSNQVKIQRDIVNMVLDVKLKEIGDEKVLNTP